MDAMHGVLVATGLFMLTFLSPGPNLLVVVQASLAGGRRAGIATGLGCAAGDGLYAALALLGLSTLITGSATLFRAVQLLGALYLLLVAARLLLAPGSTAADTPANGPALPLARHFRRGLVTDLANVQTVLFFASIFAVTLDAQTPPWAKAASWLGVVSASAGWRIGLSIAFSRPRLRERYRRTQRGLERCAGVLLGAFGLRLLFEGVVRGR